MVNCPLTSDLHIEPKKVELHTENQSLEIVWPDNHTSWFEIPWLTEREFPKTKEEQHKNSCSLVPKKSLWGGDFQIPVYSFESVISDDLSRFNWLYDLSTHGLTLLKNAPQQEMQLQKISEKVGGIIRQTHYGLVMI